MAYPRERPLFSFLAFFIDLRGGLRRKSKLRTLQISLS